MTSKLTIVFPYIYKIFVCTVFDISFACSFVSDRLTAVVLIRPIATVIVTIAHPYFGNTPVVIACKVVGSTGGREPSGAINFVRTIATIVHAVTAPAGQNAVLVVAGECPWRAGRSCCGWQWH